MPGVPGSGGPVPKRSTQRRRRNATAKPDSSAGAPAFRPPEADPAWHPIAQAWLTSLSGSGQSVFYEPSDWALAMLIAESISRDLEPQFVGFTEDGEILKESLPLKGASLGAYLKGMTALLVTEGDRRRMRLELEKAPAPGSEQDAAIAHLSEYRERAGKA